MRSIVAARRCFHSRPSVAWTNLDQSHVRRFAAEVAHPLGGTVSEFKTMPNVATAKITDYAKWLDSAERKLHVVFGRDSDRALGLFDAQPSMENFASANIGVGGSLEDGGVGLDGQFDSALADAGHSPGDFQKVHQHLFSQACTKPGMLVAAEPEALKQTNGLEAAFAMVATADGRSFVALDIFKKEHRPLHVENIAMVYCVRPDRRSFEYDEDFLEALSLLGEVCAHVCNCYNYRVANEKSNLALPPVWRVRMGLVSGGKLVGDVSDHAVALALLRGLGTGTALDIDTGFGTQGGDEMEFEMVHNAHLFQGAWDELRGSS